MLKTIYQKYILKYPIVVLVALLTFITVFGVNATKLEIDASAETLLLDNDQDLAFMRDMEKHFSGDDILIIAYKPKSDLLSKESIDTITSLTADLEKLPAIKSTDSIISVPLLFSPIRGMSDLLESTRTLKSKDINLTMVKNEFLTSPLYKNGLVNKSFTISSILIHLKEDKKVLDLLKEQARLQDLLNVNLSEETKENLNNIVIKIKKHRDLKRVENEENIKNIRTIMSKYESKATLYIGGVQMIASDIIGFVKSDLATYGSILVLLLILILGIVFRRVKWVAIPILICLLSVLAITSALGFWGWEITVISSNFIALQLIITISIILHLIVRYEELLTKYPKASNSRIILNTMLSKSSATFFAIITTIAGFSSLVFSHILPVINLGWMMSAGIIFSFIISFLVFPTVVVLLPKSSVKVKKQNYFSLPVLCSNIILKNQKAIMVSTLLLVVFSISGASQLIVENSFINYFKKDTSIYKGMKIIDQELGGTTPLDVVLTFKNQTDDTENSDDTSQDEFADEFADESNDAQYWFTDEKINIIKKVHLYLENLKDIGDVKSFATVLSTGKILNDNKDLDSVEVALLYSKLPENYREIILSPYVDIENSVVRISTRIIDSNKGLRRDDLLKKITKDLNNMLDPNIVEYRLSNLMVIYNNMLQSLFTSQISTLSYVLIILSIMFLILFRSIKLTLIALTVNIIPIGIIFGFMGWLSIPLDIMTITIAAIAMGIGVDNTIHYIHRFKVEFAKSKDYEYVMKKTNESIGLAMYYTSLTIIIGFSILTLSNLVPTIYFGLLTMLVMLAALISNLILLPRLLLSLKPLK
jgi:predicted RND superfamily exporter protein